MFLGHFGVGFASKPAARRVSLGTLFMAAQFVDLVWPVLLLLGIEKVAVDPGNTAFTPLNFTYYPFSHSLVGVLIWAVLLGLVYYGIKGRGRPALLLGGLVVSHWLLDLIVHRSDLPLTLGNHHMVGLGLWNSIPLTIVVEGVIFFGGVWIYTRVTRARDKIGRYGLCGLVTFLAIVYALNMLGPPPDSPQAIGAVGLLQWLLVVWAYWIDRHRSYSGARESTPGAVAPGTKA
jgi:hypothetical protein